MEPENVGVVSAFIILIIAIIYPGYSLYLFRKSAVPKMLLDKYWRLSRIDCFLWSIALTCIALKYVVIFLTSQPLVALNVYCFLMQIECLLLCLSVIYSIRGGNSCWNLPWNEWKHGHLIAGQKLEKALLKIESSPPRRKKLLISLAILFFLVVAIFNIYLWTDLSKISFKKAPVRVRLFCRK